MSPNGADVIVENVLRTAITELTGMGADIFTFALYFDHEACALSVCVDSEKSSKATVARINSYNTTHFHRAIAQGDMESANLWQANIGRSLSLGNFEHVNIARTDVPPEIIDETFFRSVTNGLINAEQDVIALISSENKSRVLFGCSTADSEIGLVWSALEPN